MLSAFSKAAKICSTAHHPSQMNCHVDVGVGIRRRAWQSMVVQAGLASNAS